MKVLVSGGAGYIGSHTVVQLCASGHRPVIVDNFSSSRRDVISRLETICKTALEVHECDVTDAKAVERVFRSVRPEAVMHFAGLKSVPESVRQPLRYYQCNVNGTLTLIREALNHEVKRFVFSSSATVYGSVNSNPVKEDAQTLPTNPYGWSKLMSEQVIADTCVAHPGFGAVILRYFNPVGADASGLIGEDPASEPGNLMPLLCQAAAGRRESLAIYGTDYDTPDGSGLRDFIHVADLAQGHIAALDFLEGNQAAHVFNLGTGIPHSVMDLIACFKSINGVEFRTVRSVRRPGDVAASWADVAKARRDLGWRALRGLDEMCRSAWCWQEKI